MATIDHPAPAAIVSAVPEITPMTWKRVSEREMEHVRSRRPDAKAGDLVGLAISGGGIRSATFGLGVLEGLRELGVLGRVDYLSTVSGGGYIGAWLSANCRRADERRAIAALAAAAAMQEQQSAQKALDKAATPDGGKHPTQDAVAKRIAATLRLEEAAQGLKDATRRLDNEGDWLNPATSWERSIAHLRRYSNYLSPKLGLFSADTWSMFAVWIRNTLLVQVTVILGIALALLTPRPLFHWFTGWPDQGHWRWVTVALFVAGVAGIAGNLLRVTRPDSVMLRMRYWPLGATVAAICLGAAYCIGDHWHFDPFTNGPVRWPLAVPISFLLVAAGFFLLTPALKVVNAVWWGKRRAPVTINYGQGYVQLLIVVPMLATGYLVAAVLFGQIVHSELYAGKTLANVNTYGAFLTTAWRYWPLPLSVAFASLWLLAICSVTDRKRVWNWIIAFVAPIAAVLLLHVLLCAIMLLMKGWTPVIDGKAVACGSDSSEACEAAWLSFMWVPTMVLYAFSLSINMLIGILGRNSPEAVREWWSRLGAWLLIYGTAWLVVSIAAVYGPRWAVWLADTDNWTGRSTAILGWLGTTIAGLFAGNSNSTGKAKDEKAQKSMSAKALDVVAHVAPFVFIAGLLIAVATVLHVIIAFNSSADCCDAMQLGEQHWRLMSPDDAMMTLIWVTGGGVLGMLLVMAWRVDINVFSLNAFYRNRLTRCYLGATRYLPGQRRPQNFTGFDEDDDMRLDELAKSADNPKPAAPVHIVNCALNLGGSSDLSLHTRHSASFTLSPYATGSSYESRDQTGASKPLGYQPTALYGGVHGQPTLGQAISVSGAAASPNMGYHTSPVVAVLLTVFNVRLGWWFPNPKDSVDRPSPRMSLRYLVKELFGGADDKSNFLMISDGGHFENLAAYELVRRRCRVIIISDAECDPGLRFEGLGTLIRMCEVDFGAKIEIDVNAIPPRDESSWSERRCAVGKITYAPVEVDEKPVPGILIYLKASMTGHEDSATLQYKASHPLFPHEPTSNQFYGEDQFESYRRLGKEVTLRTLRPVMVKWTSLFDRNGNPLPAIPDPTTVDEDFVDQAAKLRAIWSPSLPHTNRFTQHAKELMNLWSEIGADRKKRVLPPNAEELLAAPWPNEESKGQLRDVFFVSSQMLQLMENVYLDLNLEETWDNPDNEGWRKLFESWTQSPAMLRTWELTSQHFGKRFQYFCERNLDLDLPKPDKGA